uniref:Uncharacterized protein n=1 Tax=Rhizophora mucronata TaxID=61149 RepID=A0A2P2QRW0_RHIMU
MKGYKICKVIKSSRTKNKILVLSFSCAPYRSVTFHSLVDKSGHQICSYWSLH